MPWRVLQLYFPAPLMEPKTSIETVRSHVGRTGFIRNAIRSQVWALATNSGAFVTPRL